VEEAITRHSLAVRISGLPAEQIKQAVLRWLDAEEGGLADLEQNLRRAEEGDLEESPLSPTEKAAAFRAWAESHPRGLPLLSDEAISRESMYSDERL
jgi:hypothetical protein